MLDVNMLLVTRMIGILMGTRATSKQACAVATCKKYGACVFVTSTSDGK